MSDETQTLAPTHEAWTDDPNMGPWRKPIQYVDFAATSRQIAESWMEGYYATHAQEEFTPVRVCVRDFRKGEVSRWLVYLETITHYRAQYVPEEPKR